MKQVIKDLGEELHWPQSRTLKIAPNTSLDKDLGLDSLTRVELASRVERNFGVILGEQLFLKIDTVADLLGAITGAPSFESMPGKTDILQDLSRVSDSGAVELPTDAKTLIDVIEWHFRRCPGRLHSIFMPSENIFHKITYSDLYKNAAKVATALSDKGIKKGESIAIMLPTSLEYFYCFMGTILCGASPVAIYPPVRPSQLIDHIHRHSEILRNANAKLLVTDTSALGRIGQLLTIGLKGVDVVDVKKDLLTSFAEERRVPVGEQDTAFIQYTSGSTGNPKGVKLSHANILANIRAMGATLQASPKDIFVSWLPLYHDMGLIGAWLGSMYYGCTFIVMSPFSFLSRPRIWLETLQKFSGTLTAAPNFAYELCLKHISKEEAESLDLSSIRVMCNGAEPVNAGTVSRFNERFKISRLEPNALLPVYGLAESTVGLAFPQLGTAPRIDSISREELERNAIAKPIDSKKVETIEFVSSGYPLPGHEIRVVDEVGHEMAERNEGRIQFRGPSSTSGYMNQPIETRKLIQNGWLETGDLGYIADGQLFVTGRIKDLIKRAGRNVHPEDLEMIIGDLSGVRKGCVVVFGSNDPLLGTERLVVIAETRENRLDELDKIERTISGKFSDVLGSAPDQIKLVRPHTLLKTSSGKLRRSACKKMYEQGEIDKSPTQLKFQIFVFAAKALGSRVKSVINANVASARGLLIWLFVIASATLLWPFVVFLPAINLRWGAARCAAKMTLWFAGVKLKTTGVQLCTPSIYVANHASYSDVVCLLAAIPNPIAFVAKSELSRNVAIKFTLDRLGVIYVERYELGASIQAARETTEVAKKGMSLLSFPEGTFTRAPGVLPFHMGPFLTAVECQYPVVPIALCGSRSILHPDNWVIRPGVVTVDILDPIAVSSAHHINGGTKWEAALDLRSKARTAILNRCGEPDLALA